VSNERMLYFYLSYLLLWRVQQLGNQFVLLDDKIMRTECVGRRDVMAVGQPAPPTFSSQSAF
jgi:hypothetical protein